MMKLPQIPTPKNPEKGFTLIELMIVIAIIAILVAIALPAYQNYIQKAKFSEVINSAAGAKANITLYGQENGGFANYSGDGDDQTTKAGNTASVNAVDATGVVCATAHSDIGTVLSGKIVKLTPTIAGGTVEWACQSDADAKYLPSSCSSVATIAGCG